jgi:hypothetical protein
MYFFFQEFLLGDCTKAKTVLKWEPKYSFDVSKVIFILCTDQWYSIGKNTSIVNFKR